MGKQAVAADTSQIRRGVGRPRQVTLQQILEATSAINLENLTLQAVAGELGVTPPALYRHVANREDLVNKFVGYVTEKYPIPSYQGEGWASWAISFAHALHVMYASVPGLADYTIRRTHASASVLERHETAIRVARQSGFDELGAFYATRAIVEFVAGWVAQRQRRDQAQRESSVHPDTEFRETVLHESEKKYPELKASLIAAAKFPASHRFDFTLHALVRGLTDALAHQDTGAASIAQAARAKPRRKPAR
jgi:AcrR family transcriptional regulator